MTKDATTPDQMTPENRLLAFVARAEIRTSEIAACTDLTPAEVHQLVEEAKIATRPSLKSKAVSISAVDALCLILAHSPTLRLAAAHRLRSQDVKLPSPYPDALVRSEALNLYKLVRALSPFPGQPPAVRDRYARLTVLQVTRIDVAEIIPMQNLLEDDRVARAPSWEYGTLEETAKANYLSMPEAIHSLCVNGFMAYDNLGRATPSQYAIRAKLFVKLKKPGNDPLRHYVGLWHDHCLRDPESVKNLHKVPTPEIRDYYADLADKIRKK